jgi:isopenicillin N synthase-like dioxygenase
MEFKSFNLKDFEQSTGPRRKQKAQELDAICQSSGFLLLSGHGVSTLLIDAQWNAVSSFFASDDKTKKKS